jgi:hypothetical protein
MGLPGRFIPLDPERRHVAGLNAPSAPNRQPVAAPIATPNISGDRPRLAAQVYKPAFPYNMLQSCMNLA